MSVGNSLQAYSSLYLAQRIYNNNPNSSSSSSSRKTKPPAKTSSSSDLTTATSNSTATPLSARTFGTWTIMTAVVRLAAAYNIDNPVAYQLALASYVVAWLHFTSEWLVFKTARWNSALAGPVCISTGSIVWMVAQRGYYLK